MGRVRAAVVVSAVVFLFASSCGEEGGSPNGTGGAGGSANDYASSPCGSCVVSACAAAIDGCSTDAECSAYLSCLLACPPGLEGDVDAECEATCPRPTGSAGVAAVDELTVCRSVGAGADCDDCNVSHHIGDANSILQQDCPPSTETNACYQCEDEHCCEVWETYEQTPDAVATKDCLIACWDEGRTDCALYCYELYPDGFQAWAERYACILVYCNDTDACGEEALPPCELCSNEHCAVPLVEMITNPAGYLLYWCLFEPETCDETCRNTCLGMYPSAAPLWEKYLACMDINCFAECG